MRSYTVIVEFDSDVGAYSVVVPALPGCTSQGRTLEESLTNSREAIAGHIAALQQMGQPVPEETNPPQAIRIEVAAWRNG